MANDIFSSIDPDVNIFSCLQPSSLDSPLLAPSSLYNTIPSTPDLFSLLHLNARSLFNKINHLNILLSEINHSFSIIGISETWLDDTSGPIISIPDYTFIYNNRKNKTGGGVGLFVSNKYDFIVRHDLCPYEDCIEWLAIEVIASSTNILIFIIYRPPNTDPLLFSNHLSSSLNQKSIRNKQIYIMGDFNINLLNNDVNNISANFSNLMSSMNLIPLINSPTRITDHSSTLIDNIFTNNIQKHTSVVLCNDISDHFPICTFAAFSPKANPIDKHHKYLLNPSNISALNKYLFDYDWHEILTSQDVNSAFKNFIDVIHLGLNSHCSH